MSEIFNETIINGTFKSIVSMLKEIYNKIMESIAKRKEEVGALSEVIPLGSLPRPTRRKSRRGGGEQ